MDASASRPLAREAAVRASFPPLRGSGPIGGNDATTQQSEGCAPGSAPIAVVSEAGPPPVASTTQASAEVEGSGEIRYLTLIY